MAIYPSGIATQGDLLKAKNLIQTGLSQAIDAVQVVIQVTNPTGIVPDMSLTIEKEIVKVVGVNGNNLTVVRGFDDTTASTHVIGSLTFGYIVAAHHNALSEEVIAIEAALGTNLSNVGAKSQFVGTMDAVTGSCDFTPLSGLSDGPLPAAATANNGFYVVVVVAGTPPSGPMAGVSLKVGDWVYSNGSTWTRIQSGSSSNWLDITAKPIVDPRQYQFSSVNGSTASGDLSVAGVGKTITLTPVPIGLNATDQNHYIRLSGGVGTAETVLITGGSAVSGASTGTITFNTANSHTGLWTVSSATAGCDEAIRAASANGAVPAAIAFPAGSYDFYAPCHIQWGRIAIVGLGGRALTIITNHHPSGSTFVFSGAGIQTYNRVSGIQFLAGGGKSAGWAVEATSQFYFELSDIIVDGMPSGILLNGSLSVWFSKSAIRSFSNGSGVGVRITGSGAGTDNYYFTDVEVIGGGGLSSTATAGINVVTGGGFLFTNVTTFDCGIGLLVNPQAGNEVRWGFITASNFDSNLGDGVRFEPNGTGTIRSWSFTNCWTASNSGNGFYAEGLGGGLIKGVNLDGHRSFANGLNGLSFGAGASGVRINGAKSAGNSTAAPNIHAGILFDDGISDFSVIGSLSGPYDSFATVQGRGLYVAGAASNNYMIIGNSLLGNTIGLEDNGTGTTKVIADNLVPNAERFNTVASAASITLPARDEAVILITGTTAIQTMSPVWGGRKVSLVFTNAAPGGVAIGGVAGQDFVATVAATQNVPTICEYVNSKWHCK